LIAGGIPERKLEEKFQILTTQLKQRTYKPNDEITRAF